MMRLRAVTEAAVVVAATVGVGVGVAIAVETANGVVAVTEGAIATVTAVATGGATSVRDKIARMATLGTAAMAEAEAVGAGGAAVQFGTMLLPAASPTERRRQPAPRLIQTLKWYSEEGEAVALPVERRRGVRQTVNREFRSVDEFIAEYVTNLSRSGVFIKSDEPLPVGTRVNLKFTVIMDELETIEGVGEVVRTVSTKGKEGATGMGVVFTELSSYSRQLIEKILVRRG